MTPKEKAQELVYGKFEFIYSDDDCSTQEELRSSEANDEELRKKCALICVGEILKTILDSELSLIKYWESVKNEIIKL